MASKEEKKTVGQRLVLARKTLGLTQKSLSAEAGIPLPTIKDYEGGKTMPGAKAMQKYASLGVNIGWVLDGDGPILLEGEIREAHADYVGSLAGDSEAAARREARFQSVGQRLRECSDTIRALTEQIGFEPDVKWTTLLQELMYIYNVPPEAIRRILETIKADSEGS